MKWLGKALHMQNIQLVFFFFFSFFVFTPSPGSCEETGTRNYSSVEERRIYALIKEEKENIEKEKLSLELREKELKSLEVSVDKKLDQIDRKLEELKIMQEKIKSLLAEKSKEEIKKRKELGIIYEKMIPTRAALAMTNLEPQLATDLLSYMKPKAAAKILNVLDKQKASQLSTQFSTIQLE